MFLSKKKLKKKKKTRPTASVFWKGQDQKLNTYFFWPNRSQLHILCIHTRGLHAKLEVCRCRVVKTCHQSLHTDEQTNNRYNRIGQHYSTSWKWIRCITTYTKSLCHTAKVHFSATFVGSPVTWPWPTSSKLSHIGFKTRLVFSLWGIVMAFIFIN